MRIFSNCPDELHPPNGLPLTWRSYAGEPLPPDALTVWDTLRGHGPVFSCDAAFPDLQELFVVREAAESQLVALLRALKTGLTPADATATLALTGTGFRGQRERPWVARHGNIHLCAYYRCDRETRDLGAGLTMVPSLAVIDAIRAVRPGARRLGIKWVNDIFMNGRKVAGVLTSTQAKETHVEHLVFGIGVNVAVDPQVDPTPFVPASGSLRELLPMPQMMQWDLLWPLLRALSARYRQLLAEGPAPLVEAYRACSVCLGEKVKVWSEADAEDPVRLREASPLAEGILDVIHDDLSLQVSGRAEPVAGGRLALAEQCDLFGL